MTAFRHRFVFCALSVAGTAGLVAFSSPTVAAAPADSFRQATVFTADLDLGKAAGQATFECRVAAAADKVCSQPGRDASSAETSCRRDVLSQARHEAGIVDVASN